MQVLSWKDKPLKLYGVPHFCETGRFERLPEEIRAKVPTLENLGRRCPGARLRFRTNSPTFKVSIDFEKMTVDNGMAIYAAQSANVMIDGRYVGLVKPVKAYEIPHAEGTFKTTGEMQDVTVFLPRNEVITNVTVELEDGAVVEEHKPYKYEKPIIYYGSSITEGGCATRVMNAYNTRLSIWLDTEFYNFGFSGSAKGELEIADYINTFDMSVFVMDYDHNAPNAKHLEKTHEPFFKRIREAHPDLPILILTKPDAEYEWEYDRRRDVIYQTYLNAKNSGDDNVYFIDGKTYFGTEDRDMCSVDTCHPNDLGFYFMAKTIYPVLKEILEK